MAERLSRADVGYMYLHHGCLDCSDGIADADAGVGVTGSIENDALRLAETDALGIIGHLYYPMVLGVFALLAIAFRYPRQYS